VNRINPIIIAMLLGILIVFGCMAISTAAGIGYSESKLFMPNTQNDCRYRCMSAIPMPTLTPTPDIGEPPLP